MTKYDCLIFKIYINRRIMIWNLVELIVDQAFEFQQKAKMFHLKIKTNPF